MRYWIYLSWRYMMKHKSRTLYSVFGIIITVIMCFSVITTGLSVWDYEGEMAGVEHSQLWLFWADMDDYPYLTEGRIATLQKLDQCQEVRKLWILNRTWQKQDQPVYAMDEEDPEAMKQYYCSVDEIQPGDICDIEIQLNDISNLEKSADILRNETGLDIEVKVDVQEWLGQGEDSLTRSMYGVFVSIVAAVISLFSIMIIRNTLMISVVERMRDYGVYRCVGMSRKQLYHLLSIEGLFMSLIAAVLGSGAAYGFLQMFAPWLNQAMSLKKPLHFGFYPQAVLYVVILSVMVTLFALLEPARQAGQLSPTEAIHNNIVLRSRRGKLKESLAYHQGRIWGKIFGASGEYAYKNIQRHRGRFSGLFFSLLLCVVMTGLTNSFSHSLYATVENVYQGRHIEYLEAISPAGAYDANVADRIRDDLAEMDTVQKTGLHFEKIDLYGIDPKVQKYLEEAGVMHYAYDKQDIQALEKYLLDGSIDYDAMTQDNAVLLCDMKYNVSNIHTDFEEKDIRITDYRVGDHITNLSPAGYEHADQIYDEILHKVAEKEGIPATAREAEQLRAEQYGEKTADSDEEWSADGYPCVEYYDEEDEGFERCRQEMIQMLRQQGIDIVSKTEQIKVISDVFRAIAQWECEHGAGIDYVICGIVSENPFRGNVQADVQFIHTVDAVIPEGVDNKRIHCWGWSIAVNRDLKSIGDGALQQYCIDNQVGNTWEGMDDFDLSAYMDMLQNMKVARLISILVTVAITLICMVQLYNTMSANIVLRDKELWLYEVVGMSRSQERRMLVMEHGAAALAAVIAGYLAARGLSWYLIEYIYNQDGRIQYVWSGISVICTGAGILFCTLIICMIGIGGVRKR